MEKKELECERCAGDGVVVPRDVVQQTAELMQRLLDTVNRGPITGNPTDSCQQGVVEAANTVGHLLEGFAGGQRVAVPDERTAPDADELFDEVGKLTRKLHSSLAEFSVQISPQITGIVEKDMPEAATQLEAVIAMTDKAAHKVLELVEKQAVVLGEEKKLVSARVDEIINAKPATAADWEKLLRQFSAELAVRNDSAAALNTEILMAQEFQDLTGQSLKKVIRLIREVEESLVSLIKMFGLQEQHPQQASTAGSTTPTAGYKQDDVDSLLASLGF